MKHEDSIKKVLNDSTKSKTPNNQDRKDLGKLANQLAFKDTRI